MLADGFAGVGGAVLPVGSGINKKPENAADVVAHLLRDGATGVEFAVLLAADGAQAAGLLHGLHEHAPAVPVGGLHVRSQRQHTAQKGEGIVSLRPGVLPHKAHGRGVLPVPCVAAGVPDSDVHAVEQRGIAVQLGVGAEIHVRAVLQQKPRDVPVPAGTQSRLQGRHAPRVGGLLRRRDIHQCRVGSQHGADRFQLVGADGAVDQSGHVALRVLQVEVLRAVVGAGEGMTQLTYVIP